ncbi:hypothetical protein [Kitasatospora sp. NPDC001132]
MGNQAIQVYPDTPNREYPGQGPVVLRTSEKAPSQVYCTNSVSFFGFPNGGPAPRFVIGSGCVVETNPFVID